MKTQINGVTGIIDFFAQYTGLMVLVLALMFGVFGGDWTGNARLELVSGVLAVAGLGLLVLDIKLRVSAQRIDTLEQELKALRDRLVADEAQSVRDRNGRLIDGTFPAEPRRFN